MLTHPQENMLENFTRVGYRYEAIEPGALACLLYHAQEMVYRVLDQNEALRIAVEGTLAHHPGAVTAEDLRAHVLAWREENIRRFLPQHRYG